MNADKRALVVGWFSFSGGHATAGDEMAADVLTAWLEDAGYAVDRAFAKPFAGDVDWRKVAPESYAVIFFVCGPFEPKLYEAQFFEHFRSRRVIGVNLTLNETLDFWNPFDRLYERDSKDTGNPEMAFIAQTPKVPVIGKCLVEDYPEGITKPAHKAIERLLKAHPCATVPIDTRLDVNEVGLTSKAQVESLIARMDAVVTTRLHGMVLALKNGVPVVPIDPKPGGGKIVMQARTIGWPVAFAVDDFQPEALARALEFCLTPRARKQALKCCREAGRQLKKIRRQLVSEIEGSAMDTRPDLKAQSREQLYALLDEKNSG